MNKKEEGFNIDNHKLIYHPERVAEWHEKSDCFPIYVEIGLTNACNHKCIFCALDFLENCGNFIDRDVMIMTLKELAENGVKSIMFAGEGESVMHPDIEIFVQKAKQFGLDISITTNGACISKERLKRILPYLTWIRFSIDSGSPENYAKIHGTRPEDFERVIENMKEIAVCKKENNLDVTIGAQFLVIPQNLEEVEKLTKILKEINADNLQVKPYSKHPSSINDFVIGVNEYNQTIEKLREFNSPEFKIISRKATAERIDKGIFYNKCHGLSFFTLIDARGNVIPCNLYYGKEEFTYGNLYRNTFSEIWKSEKRKKVLRKLNEIGVSHCRKGCRLDVINRYLDRLIHPGAHDRFI